MIRLLIILLLVSCKPKDNVTKETKYKLQHERAITEGSKFSCVRLGEGIDKCENVDVICYRLYRTKKGGLSCFRKGNRMGNTW